MFPRDDFLNDPEGRFEYSTAFWYDGPVFYARHDTTRGPDDLRVFLLGADETFLSGETTHAAWTAMMSSRLEVREFWRLWCTDYVLEDYDGYVLEIDVNPIVLDLLPDPGLYLSREGY